MARYRTSVTSQASAEDVFDYLADFANAALWDPGVTAGELIAGTPGRTGAVYELRVSFLGRSIPMRYTVLESVPPADGFAGRVVLESITADVRSYDVITVAPTPDGCTVTYDADLALRGLRRPFDPLLRAAFAVIGNRARDGLATAVQLNPVA